MTARHINVWLRLSDELYRDLCAEANDDQDDMQAYVGNLCADLLQERRAQMVAAMRAAEQAAALRPGCTPDYCGAYDDCDDRTCFCADWIEPQQESTQ